jgi:hypothetical protein
MNQVNCFPERTSIHIRMENYRLLLIEFRNSPEQAGQPEHGLITRFAAKGNVSARYLSHINNGRKNIGEDLARRLEIGFAKPIGWMDNPHHIGSEPFMDGEEQFIRAATAIYRTSPVEAQAALLKYMVGRLEI